MVLSTNFIVMVGAACCSYCLTHSCMRAFCIVVNITPSFQMINFTCSKDDIVSAMWTRALLLNDCTNFPPHLHDDFNQCALMSKSLDSHILPQCSCTFSLFPSSLAAHSSHPHSNPLLLMASLCPSDPFPPSVPASRCPLLMCALGG